MTRHSTQDIDSAICALQRWAEPNASIPERVAYFQGFLEARSPTQQTVRPENEWTPEEEEAWNLMEARLQGKAPC